MKLFDSELNSFRGLWLQFVPGIGFRQRQIENELEYLHDTGKSALLRLSDVVEEDIVNLSLLILQHKLEAITCELDRRLDVCCAGSRRKTRLLLLHIRRPAFLLHVVRILE